MIINPIDLQQTFGIFKILLKYAVKLFDCLLFKLDF